jgi:DNA-binding transcriptional ArsR family regulator
MSNYALNWAWNLEDDRLKSGPAFTLIYLADLADHEHSCYPGVPAIAKKVRVAKSTVQEHLKTLLALGLITKERRNRPNGSRTSNRYYLQIDTDTTAAIAGEPAELGPESGGALDGTTKVRIPVTLGPDSGDSRSGFRGAILDPSEDPSEDPTDQTLELIAVEPSGPASFEEFYAAYPRREAMTKASEAFAKAAKKIPAAQLVAAAIAYRDHPNRSQNPKYLPLPATWLNQERWTDELAPDVPEQSRPMTAQEQFDATMAAHRASQAQQGEIQ